MNPGYEVLLVVVLILGNGVFALAEIAMVSSRKAKLQSMAARGNLKAATALKLLEDPERFLSAVQVGITLVGILAGAFGGAALSEDVAVILAGIPLLAGIAQTLSFILVVGAITYLSLVVGELIPKNIALRNPEWWACLVAPLLQFVVVAAAPAIAILSTSTNLVLRLTGMATAAPQSVTEEEVNVLIAEGTRSGVFHSAEGDIVARVLRLGDRPVKTMMTHRTDVVWIRKGATLADSLEKMLESGFSCYPYCKSSPDNVLGVIYLKSAWRALLQVRDGSAEFNKLDLESLVSEPLKVPESATGIEVLELFRREGRHFALVLDEFGGMAGIVTDHDVMEAMVGHVPDTSDGTEGPDIVRREDGSYLVHGWATIEELCHVLRLPPPPPNATYHTLAGLALEQIGRLPKRGETFLYAGWTFEVVDLDGSRVDQLIATPARIAPP